MNEEIQGQADSKPLLTIAIPTYNRAIYLRELLSVLFDQLIAEPRVELIISDNASPDETPSLVEEFQNRGLKIRSIRNETNIGADGNFLQCFERARGKYFWLFGDDDIVVQGGVDTVLSLLERKDHNLVYVNSFPLEDSHRSGISQVKINAIEMQNAKSFASRVHIFFTFISGNIINKERVLRKNQFPFAELLGTNLIQLGWTYAALNDFESGLFISDKLIGARVNNTGGYKLLESFGPTLKAVTDHWLRDEHLRRIIYNGTLQRFWPGMLLQYKHSANTFSSEATPNFVLTPLFRRNLRYWTFVYPMIVLPHSLAVCWLLLVRIVNRIDRACGLVLLR